MIYYIICFIVALIGGIVIGYAAKKRKNLIIDNSLLKEYELQIKEKEKKLNNINEKTENLKTAFNNIKQQTELATEAFNHLTEALKESKDRELETYYQNKLEEIKRRLKEADELLLLNYSQNKLKYEKEIQEIQKELEEFKSARKAIIEEQKRQEEIKNKQDFYKLQLSPFDKEDIIQLRKTEPLLHNKEVLNKLIFETYYRKPMTDMFGRIVGNNKPCGIYKITNIKNEKAYIGKSVEIVPKRWTEHIKTSLNIGNISRTKIHDAMKEYGIENFTFEILEECSKEKLNEREKYWIAFYETNTYGYNIKSGG